MNQIKSWSYSAYTLWKQCPLKYKLLKFDKLPQDESVHLTRGIFIHSLAEHYLKGKKYPGGGFPDELKNLQEDFEDQLTYENHPEEMFSFKKDWSDCGWFDKNCWLRIKIDNYIFNKKKDTILLTDWKTGKIRKGYEDQLGLYALGAFQKFPKLTKVITDLWYIDHGRVLGGKDQKEFVFYRKNDFKRLKSKWLKKVNSMFSEKKFKAKSNPFCNWCQFNNTRHCRKK